MSALSILLVVAICITIIVVCITICKSKDKGKVGESIVKKAIGTSKENKKYVFNDYYLFENYKSVQIDHIVVTRAGVFVIETKNLSGDIFGDDFQFNWIQALNGGKVKNQFYSPVKQNETHILNLREILPAKTPFYSVVVFVSANIESVNSTHVYNLKGLKKVLKYKKKNLTPTEMLAVAKIIERHKANGRVTTSQHIESVKKVQNKIANNICPRCNSNLILKHDKTGDYYGCENPNCNFYKKSN